MHPTLGILAKSQAFFYALSFFQLDGFAVPAPARVSPKEDLRKPFGNHFVNTKGYNLLMAVVISLRDMVDELQMVSHESHVYLKKSTGKVISIRDDDFEMVRNMEEFDEIEEDADVQSDDGSSGYSDLETEFLQDVKNVLALDDDYLKLPGKFDIDEYEIMERFCLSISDEKTSAILLGKIRGAGAFRRFKDTIYQYEIEKDWFKFKDEAYKEIAVAWLESHGFDYTDDMNKREEGV